MTMTLSSATASAKAAQAELTAPVAANHGGARDGMPTPAPGNNAADNGGRVPPKSPPLPANSQGPLASQARPATRSATPAGQDDPVSHPAGAEPAADDGQAATPLFAQLLNLADQAAAAGLAALGADTATTATATADGGDGADNGANSANAAANAATLVPAMFGALLSAAPLAGPAASSAPSGAADSAVRADAVGATATLNGAATRLNLSAVGVAVTPAPLPSTAAPAADDAAATVAAPAPAGSAPAGTPQNLYAMANSAALGAQLQQGKADASTPAGRDGGNAFQTQTQTQTLAHPAPDSGPATAAPIPAAGSAFTAPLPRVSARGAEPADAPDSASYSAAGSAVGVAVKDDSIVRTAAPAPAPVGSSVGFSQSSPAATPAAAAVVKLAGAPDQWQQPLREALGDRLQVQLQRNNDHAVIRLEPPNMGSIEISIRHSAGALQVNLSANHSEVLRQLNSIGDSVRQDLSSRQFADVSVTVSSSRAQAQADSGGRNGQQREQDQGRTPGRALDDEDSSTTFAMTSERE